MKFRIPVLTALVVGLLAVAACNPPAPPPPPSSTPAPPNTPAPPAQTATPPAPPAPPAKGKRLIASIETSKGLIQFEMMPEIAPKACENFKLLASRGYYNKLIFHRIIRGFMIQTGDPLGTGMGGESAFGHDFEDEIDLTNPVYIAGYKAGTVALANKGPNTNGSQFFIMHKDFDRIPKSYTIFGRVIKGLEVVDEIANVPTGPGDRPLTPVRMLSVRVTEE
jgi:cyclophilin family peptidyl-prolyl cis-trans isomerase